MKLLERLNKLRFDMTVRAILRTPPLVAGTRDLTVLSMVQHRDVNPYLLALKSFHRFLDPARVVLVADPTLDAEDRALIRRHVPHIVIHDAAEFHRAGIPQGGTWERLTAIARYAAQSQVVQLDADTVAVAPLQEVASALDAGVSFTLATDDDQAIVGTHDIAKWARARREGGSDHIQLLAEACLDRFDAAGAQRYVRGCSGFAGFAKGTFDPDRVADFSQRMQAHMGERWAQWGTEQFASNFFVANSPGARLLPHAQYCAPHRRTADTVFFHFIGYVRYTTGLYTRVAAEVVRDLRFAAGSATRHAA